MEEKSPELPGTQPEENERFELRPCVKYAAIGLGLAALCAVEYATYRVGYSTGYEVATSCAQVQESINRTAVDNLRHFMQAAYAEDAELLGMLSDIEKELAWIRDPAVLTEAEWSLARIAMERGFTEQALPVCRELEQKADATVVWADRTLSIARNMAHAGLSAEAFRFYEAADARYKALGNIEGRSLLLSEQVELLAAGTASENAIDTLEQLRQKAGEIGEQGKSLSASILAYMGHLHRAQGNDAEAMHCFELALAGVDIESLPALASAAVCYGSALLEQGRAEQAEKLLRDGVTRLGDTPAEAQYLVSALRDLARLEQERGNADKALALLYRAEGAAEGRISDRSTFCVCLFDQRGWVHYTRGDYDSALADFNRALACAAPDEMLTQPLEGAGRSCLALGRADDAVKSLTRCVALRETARNADPAAYGRANLLLGQACDMAGDSVAAAAAYALAVDNLPEVTEENADRLYAMMGRAYALSQTGQWTAAAELWSRVLELAGNDAARREEATAQLAHCRRHGAETEVESEEAAEPATAAAEPVKRRAVRRRR